MLPTASITDREHTRPGRRWAPRWLVLVHRYLGVAIGLLMLLWCLSGIVMLFVHYPEVSERERVAGLPTVDWTRCCRDDGEVAPGMPVSAATVEDLVGTPILRVTLENGDRHLIDLSTGRPVDTVAAAVAADIASRFAGVGVRGVVPVERDQWTVTGEFNEDRPFWRLRMDDDHGTDVYVSRHSGEVVQRTTSTSRLLNWFGAIPHWLYPAVLREHTKVWAQVVIWSSLLGVFLTLVGLYLGIVVWRSSGDGLSPYRGLMRWHHVSGLFVGILTLSWVASGLLSMNPWGLLESRPDRKVEHVLGPSPPLAAVEQAVAALARRSPVLRQASLAPLDGQAFLIAGGRRFDGNGQPAPLGAAKLGELGRRLGPVGAQGMMTTEDAYYFSHHERVDLPVWRVIRRDGARFYIDPRSGALVAGADAAAQKYRWLHLGLHRFDFVPGWGRGAAWATIMVALLLAVSVGVGTGVWLAWRRIGRDVRRLRGRDIGGRTSGTGPG